MATPSISLANMRTKLDNIVGDVVSGTTDSAGSSDKTTAIDSALSEYPAHKFISWYLYMTAALEERKVKESLTPSGTLTVHHAFSALVATAKVYELHRISIADKLKAINRALVDVFTLGHFYKRLYDATLWGQNEYGEPDNEFDKKLYTIPATFEQFPHAIWLLEGYIGEHDGSDAAAILTDSTRDWTIDELIGMPAFNKTDGSSTTGTDSTATTMTGVLAGGTDDKWDADDEYIIQKPNKKPIRYFVGHDDEIDRADIGSYQFYASINEKYLIVLESKAHLSAFTTDTSTTELLDEQAEVVAYKAAANLYRMQHYPTAGQNRDDLSKLADNMEQEYLWRVRLMRMPSLEERMTLDFSWYYK